MKRELIMLTTRIVQLKHCTCVRKIIGQLRKMYTITHVAYQYQQKEVWR